jgi:hypothetical protein
MKKEDIEIIIEFKKTLETPKKTKDYFLEIPSLKTILEIIESSKYSSYEYLLGYIKQLKVIKTTTNGREIIEINSGENSLTQTLLNDLILELKKYVKYLAK